MGFMPMLVLGILFFIIKWFISIFKIVSLKIKGNVFKGKIVELNDSRKSITPKSTQSVYTYLIEVQKDGNLKKYVYNEVISGNKPSKLCTGMILDVYFDKSSKNNTMFKSDISLMKSLWDDFKYSLFAVIGFSVVFVIGFYILLSLE